MYGHLTLITGCMFAGKTTELLRRVLWAKNGEGKRVLVAKPAFDDRYSETEIKSHDGLGVSAMSVSRGHHFMLAAEDADIVFIDEAQFFEAPHFDGEITELVRGLLTTGKEVVANGLDMCAEGKPFTVTARLAAMADEVIKRTAHCTECGRPASKTLKKTEGPQIELGASDKYEARCNAHWR